MLPQRPRPASALHQFDADTVRGRDVAEQAAIDAALQLDWECHAFGAQPDAESFEIAPVQKTEMIGAPGIVARKIAIRPDRPSRDRVFAGSSAADLSTYGTG